VNLEWLVTDSYRHVHFALELSEVERLKKKIITFKKHKTINWDKTRQRSFHLTYTHLIATLLLSDLYETKREVITNG